jgi:Ca2+-binding RTX toxin-like protein
MSHLDTLEQRRLLSATITLVPKTGQLFIQGDKNNDDLLVTVSGRTIAAQRMLDTVIGPKAIAPVITVFDHGKPIFNNADFPKQAIRGIYMLGSAGDDLLAVKTTNAPLPIVVDGERGNDQIALDTSGQNAPVQVFGGDDADLITGTTSYSVPFTFDAGAGDDMVALEVAGMQGHTVHGGAGDDRLLLSAKLDTLGGRVAGFTAYGDDGNDYIQGSDLNDQLFSGEGNNELHGEGGNDLLVGGSGDDMICGDEGNDMLDHGGGNDIVDGGAGYDKAIAGEEDKVIDVEELLNPL